MEFTFFSRRRHTFDSLTINIVRREKKSCVARATIDSSRENLPLGCVCIRFLILQGKGRR